MSLYSFEIVQSASCSALESRKLEASDVVSGSLCIAANICRRRSSSTAVLGVMLDNSAPKSEKINMEDSTLVF
ncbi:hypothetical protein D9M70_548290 [compost metagenome]